MPIETEPDMLQVLELHRQQPRLLHDIAAEGARSRRTLLTRGAVEHYMEKPLRRYSELRSLADRFKP